VRTEGRQREAVGGNHHQRCKHLRSPEAGTPVSSSPFASLFQIELLQEHCAKVIYFTQCSCTREFTSRVLLVFWPGPVTGPGWLGLAQPMWAELGPTQKNKIKK
jgi:hypothetical protein